MEAAWQQSFRIDQTEVGFLSSSFFYGYALMQVPAGFLFDAIGIQKIIRYAVSLFIIGLIMLASTSSFYIALCGRFMMGTGAGFAFVGMVFTAASWFGPRLFTSFVGLGEMLSMFLTAGGQASAPRFILQAGWRSLLYGFIGVGLLFLLLIFIFLKNPPHYQKLPYKIWPQFKKYGRAVMTTPSVWLAGAYCSGMFGVITIFASLWGNPYLQNRYHLDYLSASHLIALIPFGFGLGCPLLGAINERYIPHQKLIITLAFALLGCTLTMMYAGNDPTLLRISLFFMGFLGGGNVIAFYIAERSVPPEMRGIAIGLCNALTICAGIIFQPLIGMLWPHWGVHAMLVFPGLLFFSSIITLIYKNRPFA